MTTPALSYHPRRAESDAIGPAHQRKKDPHAWGPEEESAALGVFEASSTWLKIQKDCLTVEIWEENADDTLIGTESISNVPGLVEALARIRSEVAAEMANRLLK